jgi:hypothetical protein
VEAERLAGEMVKLTNALLKFGKEANVTEREENKKIILQAGATLDAVRQNMHKQVWKTLKKYIVRMAEKITELDDASATAAFAEEVKRLGDPVHGRKCEGSQEIPLFIRAVEKLVPQAMLDEYITDAGSALNLVADLYDATYVIDARLAPAISKLAGQEKGK